MVKVRRAGGSRDGDGHIWSAERQPVGESARAACWGEVLWDLFPDGRRLGGAPSNVAFHLSALGRLVDLISRVGADQPGSDAIDSLARAGVGVDAVQTDPQRPTGAVEVEMVGGEPRYRLRPGCAWECIEAEPARERLSSAVAFCYGTLSQRTDRGMAGWGQAVAMLSADCVRVCDVNLRLRDLDRELLDAHFWAADIVKLNCKEASVLAELCGTADMPGYLIESRGVRLVALTRGADGCELITTDDRVEQAGFPASSSGDNVGAGDAFVAALIAGLLGGASLAATAEGACRYGAQVASHRGATPRLDVDDVTALLRVSA